ncbi:hypothetical protein B0I35DRAFT_19739 [Stachybotrys elegans]|uniref:Uncharacterized protein n=1 Tax=Stachybotrys elegans TaxID=80388 RepID=A0A8K0T248_9HYPO|nr:hypothetical protein B0I35DRAFT_19739 [Stachybotrys elegans]
MLSRYAPIHANHLAPLSSEMVVLDVSSDTQSGLPPFTRADPDPGTRPVPMCQLSLAHWRPCQRFLFSLSCPNPAWTPRSCSSRCWWKNLSHPDPITPPSPELIALLAVSPLPPSSLLFEFLSHTTLLSLFLFSTSPSAFLPAW